jgi:DNA-binding MarR family transcriptional regulator
MALTPTSQLPASAVAHVDTDEQTPAQVWRALATAEPFQQALVDAVRDLLSDVPYHARQREFVDAGVTAADDGYASVLVALDRPAEDERHQQALTATARFGAAEASLLGHLDLDAVSSGPLAALEAADREPTVAVRLSAAVRERDHSDRERLLALLGRLAQACDVRVVTSGLTARWIAGEHRDVLPASFREAATAGLGSGSSIDERVEVAREELDPDGRAVSLLRTLAAEPGETLSYHGLVASVSVSQSRVSQVLGDLESLDLAERYGSRDDRRVELRPAGSALLDTLDAEIGRQAELDATFSTSGKHQTECRGPTGTREGGESGDDTTAATTGGWRTRYLPRRSHHAAATTAVDGGITALTEAFDADDGRTRWVSYDSRRGEAVIAVRASTPLQYTVSMALGLATSRFLEKTLPDCALEAVEQPPTILRDGRCIGGLSTEAAEDPATLRENLVEWGEQIANLTTKLRTGEVENRSRTVSELVRSAHGLAGTIVHLLDVIGVDVVREVRVPRGLSTEQLADLAETVSVSTAIQSEYSDRALYRQVFEHRKEKRETAFGVTVDAADPLGRFIGGLVLRGPDVHRFVEHVEGALPTPRERHEDAPEIAVPVTVGEPGRAAYAETVARMCQTKDLEPTREAVTVLQALTGSPYAVADALHWLGNEDVPRKITLDEVRMALSHLDAGQLLPDCPPTAGKAVQALLRSATPLSQTEIAEAADVSARSLRTHLGLLSALSLVHETDDGLLFALPPRDERGARDDAPRQPAPLSDPNAAAQDLLYEGALELVDDAARFGDPEDPLGRAFTRLEFDEAALLKAVPDLDPWVRVARALCDDPDPEPATVMIGELTDQTALDEVAA